MNLHGIAAGTIAAINPLVPLTVQVSVGSTQSPTGDGTRVPAYAAPVVVFGQVQPMTWRDIEMTDGLNLNGTRRSIYLNGAIDGLVRVSNKGGDLITDAAGNVWLVALVLEQWPDWCKVAVTLQDGS